MRKQLNINIAKDDRPMLEEFEKIKPDHQSKARAFWEAIELYIEEHEDEREDAERP